jgi:hypothetical protein
LLRREHLLRIPLAPYLESRIELDRSLKMFLSKLVHPEVLQSEARLSDGKADCPDFKLKRLRDKTFVSSNLHVFRIRNVVIVVSLEVGS